MLRAARSAMLDRTPAFVVHRKLGELMVAAKTHQASVGPPSLVHVRELPQGVKGCHPCEHNDSGASAPRQVRHGKGQAEHARADDGCDGVEPRAAPAALAHVIHCDTK